MSDMRSVMVTDWDDQGFGARFWQVVARLDAANAEPDVTIDVPFTTAAKRRDGSVPVVSVVTFDGSKIRDTWVHGWMIDAGYVAVISW